MCGNGVISFIDITFNPAEASALTADSLPEPGPLTLTSIDKRPIDMTSFATFSAATEAAYDVFLRDPLNPDVPAVDQAITLPNLSAIDLLFNLGPESLDLIKKSRQQDIS